MQWLICSNSSVRSTVVDIPTVVDKLFYELSPVDFVQEQWKRVYPVACGSCILSMYSLGSGGPAAGPMTEIASLQVMCVFVCVHVCAGRTRLSVLWP